ncbi:MAG: 4Fe-4S binding protein [bacterium]|nr:4Fe-4S binding protein [bacterium]
MFYQEERRKEKMAAVVDKENCVACEMCIDVCPTNAISMIDDVAVVNEDECTDCGTCVEECPNEAISIPA